MIQLAAGLVAVTTPWMVVRIARAIATRRMLAHARPLRADVVLARGTVLSAMVIGAFALWLPARSIWMGAIDSVAFAGLAAIALRALRNIDDATRAVREVESATRAASLVARQRHHYLPSSWRMLLFGETIAGLALFAWRLTVPPSSDRRLFVPVAFALVAPVFLWLYESWIHGLVTGPALPASRDVDDERKRSIRIVFAAECILVTAFLALAHGLLDLDWTTGGLASGTAVAGAVLGVIGCALAVSSELWTRRYRTIE